MKIKYLLVFIMFTFLLSSSVDTWARVHKKECTTVGAPLDGGLLTILGAAGVAYFVARKKKKNGEVL